MKKLITIFFVVLFFAFLYGCSDSTTESKQTTITETQIAVANDSLNIAFNVSGTTYDYSAQDASLNFSGVPAIKYNVSLSAGSANIWLYNNDSTNVWGKSFTTTTKDSLVMNFIPKKYKFTLNGFTGTGSIMGRKN